MKDPNLARATKAEKGFFIDLLCLMFECDERGVIATAGCHWSDDEITGAICGDKTENLLCLQGLLRKGVIHRNESGAIYSRRMVRDEEIRKTRASCGVLGGRPTVEKKQNESKAKAKRKQNITPSSSSSSSTSTTNIHTPIVPLKPQLQKTADFIQTTEPFKSGSFDVVHFLTRAGAVYKPEQIDAALREIVDYCARKPIWETKRRDWPRTIIAWLKRSQKRDYSAQFVKTI